MKPSIFRYCSCSIFLKDWFEWKKGENPHFSHRAFAAKAGLPSHNYAMRIINGSRNLSEEYLHLIAEGMKLNPDERNYFELMLQLEKEKSGEQKTALFRAMLDLRQKHQVVMIEGDQLIFFEKWYYPLIWEIVVHGPFGDDFKAIGQCCVPVLSVREVRRAVETLVGVGLLAKDTAGNYRQVSPTITTGDEITAGIVRNYHRQHLLKSAEMLDIIPSQERDISSVTVPVSRESFFKMKTVIQQCRKQLLEIAAADPNPDGVCIAAFQLLPQAQWEVARDSAQ